MKKALMTFLQEEKGATAIEYGLIAGLISIAIIAGVTLLGSELARVFNAIKDKLAAISIT